MPNVIRLRPARQAPCVALSHSLVTLAERLAAAANDTARLEIDDFTKGVMLQSLVTAVQSLQRASDALGTGVMQTHARSDVGCSTPGS